MSDASFTAPEIFFDRLEAVRFCFARYGEGDPVECAVIDEHGRITITDRAAAKRAAAWAHEIIDAWREAAHSGDLSPKITDAVVYFALLGRIADLEARP